MKYQHPASSTTPASIQEWLEKELFKSGIDSVYSRYILSLLQEDYIDIEPSECQYEAVCGQKQKICQKHGGVIYDLQYSKLKPAKGKKKEEKKHLHSSTPCCDSSRLFSHQQRNKYAAIECMVSAYGESVRKCIEQLVEEICEKLTLYENSKCSGLSHSQEENGRNVPPSSSEDEDEKYSAAFPPLSSRETNIRKKDMQWQRVVDHCTWSNVLSSKKTLKVHNSKDSNTSVPSNPYDTSDISEKENVSKNFNRRGLRTQSFFESLENLKETSPENSSFIARSTLKSRKPLSVKQSPVDQSNGCKSSLVEVIPLCKKKNVEPCAAIDENDCAEVKSYHSAEEEFNVSAFIDIGSDCSAVTSVKSPKDFDPFEPVEINNYSTETKHYKQVETRNLHALTEVKNFDHAIFFNSASDEPRVYDIDNITTEMEVLESMEADAHAFTDISNHTDEKASFNSLKEDSSICKHIDNNSCSSEIECSNKMKKTAPVLYSNANSNFAETEKLNEIYSSLHVSTDANNKVSSNISEKLEPCTFIKDSDYNISLAAKSINNVKENTSPCISSTIYNSFAEMKTPRDSRKDLKSSALIDSNNSTTETESLENNFKDAYTCIFIDTNDCSMDREPSYVIKDSPNSYTVPDVNKLVSDYYISSEDTDSDGPSIFPSSSDNWDVSLETIDNVEDVFNPCSYSVTCESKHETLLNSAQNVTVQTLQEKSCDSHSQNENIQDAEIDHPPSGTDALHSIPSMSATECDLLSVNSNYSNAEQKQVECNDSGSVECMLHQLPSVSCDKEHANSCSLKCSNVSINSLHLKEKVLNNGNSGILSEIEECVSPKIYVRPDRRKRFFIEAFPQEDKFPTRLLIVDDKREMNIKRYNKNKVYVIESICFKMPPHNPSRDIIDEYISDIESATTEEVFYSDVEFDDIYGSKCVTEFEMSDSASYDSDTAEKSYKSDHPKEFGNLSEAGDLDDDDVKNLNFSKDCLNSHISFSSVCSKNDDGNFVTTEEVSFVDNQLPLSSSDKNKEINFSSCSIQEENLCHIKQSKSLKLQEISTQKPVTSFSDLSSPESGHLNEVDCNLSQSAPFDGVDNSNFGGNAVHACTSVNDVFSENGECSSTAEQLFSLGINELLVTFNDEDGAEENMSTCAKVDNSFHGINAKSPISPEISAFPVPKLNEEGTSSTVDKLSKIVSDIERENLCETNHFNEFELSDVVLNSDIQYGPVSSFKNGAIRKTTNNENLIAPRKFSFNKSIGVSIEESSDVHMQVFKHPFSQLKNSEFPALQNKYIDVESTALNGGNSDFIEWTIMDGFRFARDVDIDEGNLYSQSAVHVRGLNYSSSTSYFCNNLFETASSISLNGLKRYFGSSAAYEDYLTFYYTYLEAWNIEVDSYPTGNIESSYLDDLHQQIKMEQESILSDVSKAVNLADNSLSTITYDNPAYAGIGAESSEIHDDVYYGLPPYDTTCLSLPWSYNKDEDFLYENYSEPCVPNEDMNYNNIYWDHIREGAFDSTMFPSPYEDIYNMAGYADCSNNVHGICTESSFTEECILEDFVQYGQNSEENTVSNNEEELNQHHANYSHDRRRYQRNDNRRLSDKPCLYYLRGRCRRQYCSYSHDASIVTCRFWKEGNCFKHESCPFLHGFPRSRPPPKMHRKLSSAKPAFNCQLNSDIDFPTLPSANSEEPASNSNSHNSKNFKKSVKKNGPQGRKK